MLSSRARATAAGLLLALCVLITGCSSGPPQPPVKTDVPATTYDVWMMLCGAQLPGCVGDATAGETAAIRKRLLADDDVRGIRYLTQPQTVRLVQVANPADSGLLDPRQVTASFFLQLKDPKAAAGVVKRYEGKTAGVGPVIGPCREFGTCSVAVQRKAGLVS